MSQSEPWGKLDRDSGARHHLAHHCADVAAAFLACAALPVMRDRMERAARHTLGEVEIERLAVLTFMHDIGKLFPTFQAKGWPPLTWPDRKSGHVREALCVLCDLPNEMVGTALRVEQLVCWVGGSGLFEAVLAHHGRPVEQAEDRRGFAAKYWRPAGSYDPNTAACEIGALLDAWFPLAFTTPDQPLPSTPEFEHLFAGLVALADWIGSSLPTTRYVRSLDREYFAAARREMAARLEAYGFDAAVQRAQLDAVPTFQVVAGKPSPLPQQELVGETELDARLVILEAETGSGKTEAALWRYAQLFAAGRVDGLYFAVPTRAAAVQLHQRVADAAKRLFGNADPQAVLALPGYRRAGEASGQSLPNWKVRWDDDEGANERELLARWAAEDTKKYLAAQIAVGTVDQAMLGGLLVKHAHVRGASLSRSLLVIDEVHASDRYMTAIQRRLLDQHTKIGGYAMLMSATLGSVARAKWTGRKMPSLAEALATPYPAVWTDREVKPRFSSVSPVRSKDVTMSAVATMSPAEAARLALDAARQGARVLVIRNTVTRAIETLDALETTIGDDERHLLFDIGGVPTLHHSRFAPPDRRLLDRAVEKALEPSKDRAPGGKIVIGTQTVEQSLDICADHLITDLCPIDVLLQRIGRLHRHDLPRPVGFAKPRCVVLVPEAGLAPLLAPSFDNGLGGWRNREVPLQGVYTDLAVLELTRRQIERHQVWTIPAMNRQLVEQATHDEAVEALLAELGAPWRKYHDQVMANLLALSGNARLVALDRAMPFAEVRFPKNEEAIRTRLGGEGARLKFATPQPGPFGVELDEVVLPAHWPIHIPVDEIPTCTPCDDGRLVIETSRDQYEYGRYGLRRRTTT